MKNALFVLLAVAAAMPASCFAQDGTDISTAIPIYLGQTINDTVDSKTRPYQVYSIALGKGQEFSATVTSSAYAGVFLGDSNVKAVGLGPWLKQSYYGPAESVTYQVAASGVYYIAVGTNVTGSSYKLVVNSTGPIVPVNTFTSSSCVTGPVDYISYSLGLIAAGLPDEASVNGQKMCASCAIKPPAYPQLVDKMEKAMGLGLNVSACYDSGGNIGQLKLSRP